jgi:hypothetical protein
MSALELFWDYFWKKEHSIEVVLNRQERKKWKEFFSHLKDEPCWNCTPDYMAGRKWIDHAH